MKFKVFLNYIKNDHAATAIEYAIIAVGIALTISATIYSLGANEILNLYKSVVSAL